MAQYYYDALGRRVLCEYVYNGTLDFDRRYVYGNYIDEVLLMNDGSDDYYFAHDHLYSPAALLSSSSSVVERYEYDAYGDCNVMNASYGSRTTSLYGNTVAFTGRTLDILDNGGLKLMYYRNRYYSPQMGRFLSQDPLNSIIIFEVILHNTLEANTYQYTKSNPILYYDPMGFEQIGVNCKTDETIFNSVLAFNFRIVQFGLSVGIRRTDTTCDICCPNGAKGQIRDWKETRVIQGNLGVKGKPWPIPGFPALTITPSFTGSAGGGGTVTFRSDTCRDAQKTPEACFKIRGQLTGKGCLGVGPESPVEGCLSVSCVFDKDWGEGCIRPKFSWCCRARLGFCVRFGRFWKNCWSGELFQIPSGCGLLPPM